MEKKIIEKLINILIKEENKFRKLKIKSTNFYNDEAFIYKHLNDNELEIFKKMCDNYSLIVNFYRDYHHECWKTYLKVENKEKKELLNEFKDYL